MPLHPDVEKLAATLGKMVSLLRLYDNGGWADELDRCRAPLERSDFFGVERLLGLFGGMGSLNDIVLHRDGVADAEDNDAFQELICTAREQAMALARD